MSRGKDKVERAEDSYEKRVCTYAIGLIFESQTGYFVNGRLQKKVIRW